MDEYWDTWKPVRAPHWISLYQIINPPTAIHGSDGSTSSTRVLYEKKKYPITVTDNNTGCSDASTLDLQYKNRIFPADCKCGRHPYWYHSQFLYPTYQDRSDFQTKWRTWSQSLRQWRGGLTTDIIGNSKEIVIDFNKQTKNFKLKGKNFDQAGCEMSKPFLYPEWTDFRYIWWI